MIIVVILFGLISALIAAMSLWRPFREYVIRRFRKSPRILFYLRSLSLFIALISIIVLVWFRESLLARSLVCALFAMMLIVCALSFDRFRIVRQPSVNPRVYLVVAAHPGDIGYGCGGTLAKLADSNHEIHAVVITNGRSDDDVNTLPEKKRGWAKLLGCHSVLLGNIPVEDAEHERDRILDLISEQIEKYKPDVILTHSLHDSDPDHLLVSQAVARAATSRQSVYGFKSIATTDEFHPARSKRIGDYRELKNYILSDFHSEWDRAATEEDFEMIRVGQNASL